MTDLTKHLESSRRQGGINRRMFLAAGAALGTFPWLASRSVASPSRRIAFADDPFTLGVASGDPTSSGVVLWTRLAPKPFEPGGGMPAEAVDVGWEIASDDAMKNIVAKGVAVATPQLGHSVHVEVEGLKPDRWYWYRFRAGDAESRIARARTFPEASSKPDMLRFAFASCQNYEQGLFTAYEHMAKDELDLVIHLGDYIYEYGGRERLVRKHLGGEIKSLDDYRIRHAQYRSDPFLQTTHARCPWIVTWDDHEVDNNYANATSEETGIDSADFLIRRANGYQAYYEMMPLRVGAIPKGPDMQLYRKASYGRLAELFVLDTRQYRTDQPNGDRRAELNENALDPKNTILGPEQKGWLKAALLQSPGTWNVLAQQVMMGMVDLVPGEDDGYSMDQWPGYAHERIELVQFLADRKVPNPVVITGDIHSNWVNDLRVDDRQAETPVVATEYVGTSIASGGNGSVGTNRFDAMRPENPGLKFYNAQRGYVRCTVTPKAWRSDYVVVEDVTKPGAPAVNRASFVTEAGKPGAQTA
jgi:alkaline phosphatase D